MGATVHKAYRSLVIDQCCLVQDALKGKIPEHFDVFNSTMSTVIILEMVTCPQSAGQERNGVEKKNVL